MSDPLRDFFHPAALLRPRRLSGLSAWVQHIPFAMNLVARLRPRTIVELGTHAGDSYCAFCQSVEFECLATRCFAVDTWQGDPQSKQYGPEILADLRAHHDPLYGGFSRLVQSTFEDAASHFGDGDIDLLHVDGYHTYDAVRQDLRTWLPKMSASGIVLMHDVNVREADFGAWRAWDELKREHPHFEFLHGHGLGVVAVRTVPQVLEALVSCGEADATKVRAVYHALGESISAILEKRALVEAHVAQQRSAETRERELGAQVEAFRGQANELRSQTEAMRGQTEALRGQTEALRVELASLRTVMEGQAAALASIQGTAAWRSIQRYWRVRDRLLRPGTSARKVFDRATAIIKGRGTAAAVADGSDRADPALEYARWMEQHQLTAERLDALHRDARALTARPLISVLTPVFNIDEPWLRRCIESVRSQVYDNWELCIVDDASTQPHVQRVLAEYATLDPRIRVERLERNSGIVAASARALAMAQGEYVALLDHDDELTPDALLEIVKLLIEQPELDLVYTDEDKLDPSGRRVEPFFKPDWSPDLLLSINYICHLSVYRRRLLEEVGGFRPGFDGSQDYDLVLRFTERTQRIGHIPKILYHWRKVPRSTAAIADAKPYAFESAQKALRETLQRRGVDGAVTMSPPGMYTIRYAIRDEPFVSIIIPTKDKADILRTTIDSIEQRSSWRNRELLIVDNGSIEAGAQRYLEELGRRHRVLPYPEPFNWSAINNFAAARARGEYLLFLNNDVEVIAPDWIEALLEHAQRPEIGAVGAKLLYPTRTVQHAGVVMGVGGVANHAFRRLAAEDNGYFGLPNLVRNCSAVTGACMMVRADLFRQQGGFDEKLRVAFNDIDFCLRLRERGLYVVYTPHALLYHYESATRGALHPPEDDRLMRERWRALIDRDPFYNPNLSVTSEDYRLRA